MFIAKRERLKRLFAYIGPALAGDLLLRIPFLISKQGQSETGGQKKQPQAAYGPQAYCPFQCFINQPRPIAGRFSLIVLVDYQVSFSLVAGKSVLVYQAVAIPENDHCHNQLTIF